MNNEEEMKRLKGHIADVYAQREQLKSALDKGELAPRIGFSQLESLDKELSDLDTRFKTLWDNANGAKPPHPAALWALSTGFEPIQLDCVTALMLKILAGKCTMNQEQKNALAAVYDVVKMRSGQGLGDEVHPLIAAARQEKDGSFSKSIHDWHARAEAHIPHTVLKNFERFLQSSLPVA
jgi:hypothetical protein